MRSMASFGSHRSGAEPEDPAASAARVIADEVLSIFEAVRARTMAISADARREAEERGGSATGRALAKLEAISNDVQALARELGDVAAERAARSGHE
jgi:hypothetical protein